MIGNETVQNVIKNLIYLYSSNIIRMIKSEEKDEQSMQHAS
jgi:hypothetical protein